MVQTNRAVSIIIELNRESYGNTENGHSIQLEKRYLSGVFMRSRTAIQRGAGFARQIVSEETEGRKVLLGSTRRLVLLGQKGQWESK